MDFHVITSHHIYMKMNDNNETRRNDFYKSEHGSILVFQQFKWKQKKKQSKLIMKMKSL